MVTGLDQKVGELGVSLKSTILAVSPKASHCVLLPSVSSPVK